MIEIEWNNVHHVISIRDGDSESELCCEQTSDSKVRVSQNYAVNK
jgi:hypothetical protein